MHSWHAQNRSKPHAVGCPVQVGNFRVEPPGLFRGRGEHPRMGMLKKRIYPKDITINIGKGEPIPEHPYPGQAWKEIRHDNTVTWLAFWKDTISEKVGPGQLWQAPACLAVPAEPFDVLCPGQLKV